DEDEPPSDARVLRDLRNGAIDEWRRKDLLHDERRRWLSDRGRRPPLDQSAEADQPRERQERPTLRPPRPPTSVPRPISPENGRKNFSDAAAHNEYRTPCRRNASVTSQASATKSV